MFHARKPFPIAEKFSLFSRSKSLPVPHDPPRESPEVVLAHGHVAGVLIEEVEIDVEPQPPVAELRFSVVDQVAEVVPLRVDWPEDFLGVICARPGSACASDAHRLDRTLRRPMARPRSTAPIRVAPTSAATIRAAPVTTEPITAAPVTTAPLTTVPAPVTPVPLTTLRGKRLPTAPIRLLPCARKGGPPCVRS